MGLFSYFKPKPKPFGQLQVIRLEPGDVVIANVTSELETLELWELRRQLRDTFPNHSVVILDDQISLEVVRSENRIEWPHEEASEHAVLHGVQFRAGDDHGVQALCDCSWTSNPCASVEIAAYFYGNHRADVEDRRRG